MDKITEIRDSMAEKFAEDKYEVVTKVHEYNNAMDLANGFVNGFDAVMDLQLPVRFLDWHKDNNITQQYIGDWRWGFQKKHYTTQELYKYWLENIYSPEQVK